MSALENVIYYTERSDKGHSLFIKRVNINIFARSRFLTGYDKLVELL